MHLLLHTCCAPCSIYCLKSLRQEGLEPTLFWYNPNIHPHQEYQSRLDCLKDYAKSQNAALIVEDDYGLDDFVCQVARNLETRCADFCYPKRLRKTFEYAKQNGYDAVSTTLLYSIYQQHDLLKDLGEALAKEFGIEFLYRDFRTGWHEGQTAARELKLYMQKYCGCIFSEEESAFGRKLSRPIRRQGIAPTNSAVRQLIERTKPAPLNPDTLKRTLTDPNAS